MGTSIGSKDCLRIEMTWCLRESGEVNRGGLRR